ncbi:hypothetical protein SBA5_600041 [Candidatus Sulfotelmatomonas gaucii]|uniref:Uncharacterized protein n=1 Tax=Candidatus Sulfuritelmatomonas gaucii TaxID=2043161 RepID=A0A2N9LX87_9BACT|nr:hypothetical protein SBA5_600041 [Candidatus Sulfotelmatomonas gaucii]
MRQGSGLAVSDMPLFGGHQKPSLVSQFTYIRIEKYVKLSAHHPIPGASTFSRHPQVLEVFSNGWRDSGIASCQFPD